MSGSPDAVIRQWFQEVWNERREDAIDRLMTPDAQVHGVSGDVIVGPGNFKRSTGRCVPPSASSKSRSFRRSWKAIA